MHSKAWEVAPKMMEMRKFAMEVRALYPSLQLFASENRGVEAVSNNKRFELRDVCFMDSSYLPGFDISLWKPLVEGARNGNEADLSALKHFHFTFWAKMSLASFHQAVRQRTWDISCESLRYATMNPRRSWVTPDSIKGTKYEEEYNNVAGNLIQLVNSTTKKETLEFRDACTALPHCLQIGALYHVNGWNAMHSIGKRTCTKAQGEIRNIANQMADSIRDLIPILEPIVGPQCKIYGECPEVKSCGMIKKYQKREEA
jgi:thymidylate synthase (FAD)